MSDDDPTVHSSPTTALLAVIAEPTRLRIFSCVAAAPLFVSDLVAILGLPQPTVSRHLRALREQGLVIDLPIPPFVIYSTTRQPQRANRLLRAALAAALDEPQFRAERVAALERSRANFRSRVAGVEADVT